MSTTYRAPPDGWTCFHCGKRFRRYKDAERHFGRTPDHISACVDDIERLRGINGAQAMEIDLLRKMLEDAGLIGKEPT